MEYVHLVRSDEGCVIIYHISGLIGEGLTEWLYII